MTGYGSFTSDERCNRRDGRAVTAARQIRVLFINDTARNGGPGRSLHSILSFLDPAVVHRTVVLPREGPVAEMLRGDSVADDLVFESDLVENPIEPWTRAMAREDFSASGPRKAVRLVGSVFKASRSIVRLATRVRRERIDLIYCNGTNADFFGGAVAGLTGVPALWHVRYSSLPRAVWGLHRRLSASASVRRIVCVSEAAASLFEHCRPKVSVVHNGLDTDRFDPTRVRGTLRRELGLGEDVVVAGSHGRVLRRKGYVEMIRAARRVIDRMTIAEKARVTFVIAGDTPQDFALDHVEECRALASRLGIASHVHMLGFRADVRSVVADFDIAVVPSIYADPLPRAVIESMALAKPVIAFAVGGVTEMLDGGLVGELVPLAFDVDPSVGADSDSVERLADSILRAVRDPNLRLRQGRAARERACRDFDARAHALRIQNEIVLTAGLALPGAP